MAKNFHNGTNIIAKHNTVFLGEEILEFFMAPTVKTHPSVLAQKIPALYPGAKGVADRDILETCLNSPSKNRSETDAFPHGPKSLLTDQCNLRGGLLSCARRRGTSCVCYLFVYSKPKRTACIVCIHLLEMMKAVKRSIAVKLEPPKQIHRAIKRSAIYIR